jgi:hypothetical protein
MGNQKGGFMKRVIVCFLLLLSTAAVAATKTYTFEGSMEEVFDAAVKVAQTDWSVTFADRKTAMISFNTGMSLTSNGMECSAQLEPLEGGKVRISMKTQKKAQMYAWGVGDRIADKWFKGIDAEMVKTRAAGGVK